MDKMVGVCNCKTLTSQESTRPQTPLRASVQARQLLVEDNLGNQKGNQKSKRFSIVPPLN